MVDFVRNHLIDKYFKMKKGYTWTVEILDSGGFTYRSPGSINIVLKDDNRNVIASMGLDIKDYFDCGTRLITSYKYFYSITCPYSEALVKKLFRTILALIFMPNRVIKELTAKYGSQSKEVLDYSKARKQNYNLLTTCALHKMGKTFLEKMGFSKIKKFNNPNYSDGAKDRAIFFLECKHSYPKLKGTFLYNSKK